MEINNLKKEEAIILVNDPKFVSEFTSALNLIVAERFIAKKKFEAWQDTDKKAEEFRRIELCEVLMKKAFDIFYPEFISGEKIKEPIAPILDPIRRYNLETIELILKMDSRLYEPKVGDNVHPPLDWGWNDCDAIYDYKIYMILMSTFIMNFNPLIINILE